jgi:hypothetical protein
MAVIFLVFSAGAFCFGLVVRSVLDRRADARGEVTVGVLRDLVAEHLSLARTRLDAAEARICLLEERLTFHDGFLVARRPRRPRADRREGAVLRFPAAPGPYTEETPNSTR